MVDEFVFFGQSGTLNVSNKQEIINQFRYFVVDHSILMALHEEPLANDSGVKIKL